MQIANYSLPQSRKGEAGAQVCPRLRGLSRPAASGTRVVPRSAGSGAGGASSATETGESGSSRLTVSAALGACALWSSGAAPESHGAGARGVSASGVRVVARRPPGATSGPRIASSSATGCSGVRGLSCTRGLGSGTRCSGTLGLGSGTRSRGSRELESGTRRCGSRGLGSGTRRRGTRGLESSGGARGSRGATEGGEGGVGGGRGGARTVGTLWNARAGGASSGRGWLGSLLLSVAGGGADCSRSSRAARAWQPQQVWSRRLARVSQPFVEQLCRPAARYTLRMYAGDS